MGELSSCKIRIPAMLNNNLRLNLTHLPEPIYSRDTVLTFGGEDWRGGQDFRDHNLLSLSGAQDSHGFSFLGTNLDGMVLKNEKHHLSLRMLL